MIAKKVKRVLRQHQFWLLPALLIISFLVIRPQLAGLDQQLKMQAAKLVAPLLHWQQRVVANWRNRTQRQPNVSALQQTIQTLQQQVDQLQQENIELKASQKYLTDVQELLDFRQRYQLTQAIPAQVIMKNLSDGEHYFYLDRGAQHGVQVNTVAIDHHRLVGRVSVVYPTYSKLVLVTDRACKVAAYCVNARVAGLWQGQNRLDSAALKHIDHLQELINGDLVISSGEGMIFPQGFALGTIKEFSRQGVDYDVAVEPAVDLKRLQYCLLLKTDVKN